MRKARTSFGGMKQQLIAAQYLKFRRARAGKIATRMCDVGPALLCEGQLEPEAPCCVIIVRVQETDERGLCSCNACVSRCGKPFVFRMVQDSYGVG